MNIEAAQKAAEIGPTESTLYQGCRMKPVNESGFLESCGSVAARSFFGVSSST